LLVQLATYDQEFVGAVSTALDHHLQGYRLEKAGLGVASGVPPDIFTIAVAGLSAAGGAIASAFLGEIGKELWKALKGLVASWAEADRRLDEKGRQEPVLVSMSSIGEKDSETGSPAKTVQIMMQVKSPMPTFRVKVEVDGLTLTGGMRSQRPEDVKDFLENGFPELYRAVTEAKVSRAEEIATVYMRRDSKWESAGPRPRAIVRC